MRERAGDIEPLIYLLIYQVISLSFQLKMNFFLDIFQGLCLKDSEDFYRTSPCTFVVIVNKLCTVFLRKSTILLTIRAIIKSFQFPNHVFLQTMLQFDKLVGDSRLAILQSYEVGELKLPPLQNIFWNKVTLDVLLMNFFNLKKE